MPELYKLYVLLSVRRLYKLLFERRCDGSSRFYIVKLLQVFCLKTKKKVKIVCVQVIPYIHSHKGLFPYISMATITTGGSGVAATSKMECFVMIVNGWQPLTIITKRSILDLAAALDPPLHVSKHNSYSWMEFGLNRQEIFSFSAMPSPNIPDLTKATHDLPLPDSRIGAIYTYIGWRA